MILVIVAPLGIFTRCDCESDLLCVLVRVLKLSPAYVHSVPAHMGLFYSLTVIVC